MALGVQALDRLIILWPKAVKDIGGSRAAQLKIALAARVRLKRAQKVMGNVDLIA